jgi:hypothetical protein
MSAITPSSLPVWMRTTGRVAADIAAHRFRLRPCEDGWSVVGPRGELVVREQGAASRQRCLEAAQARGIVALIS